MAAVTTNKLRELLLKASGSTPFSLLDDGIRFILIDTSYVPDKTHAFVDSITGGTSKEIAGTGYSGGYGGTGRKLIGSKAVIARGDGTPALDCADPTWTGANFGTPGFLGVFKPNTSDADSPLLLVVALTSAATDGSDFTVQIPADGLLGLGDGA